MEHTLMATIELTKDNFEQTVLENDTVFVDFWAEWCGPCRSFAPTYEAASEQHQDVVFAKVNTELEQELAGYFQIRSIPTLMVFRENVILFSQPGALPEPMLNDLITQVKNVDMEDVHRQIAEHAEDDHAGHDHEDASV
jgi:thioredoxin 1